MYSSIKKKKCIVWSTGCGTVCRLQPLGATWLCQCIFSLFSGSGCCHTLREGRQEGNRSFHCSKGQDSLQASGPASFRQGASEKLFQDADIVLSLGLCRPLFPGKLGLVWTSVESLSDGGSPAHFYSNLFLSVSKRSVIRRAGREQGPLTAYRASKNTLCMSKPALSSLSGLHQKRFLCKSLHSTGASLQTLEVRDIRFI